MKTKRFTKEGNVRWLMVLIFFCVTVGLVHAETASSTEKNGVQAVSWEQLAGLAAQSPAVLAAQSRVQAAQALTGFSGRSFLPQIQGNVFSETNPNNFQNNTTAGSLEGTLNLWRGGKDEATGKAFDLRAQATLLEDLRTRAEVLFRARSLWLSAWENQQAINLLETARTQTTENKQRAEKKSASGMTSKSDVQQFDLLLMEISYEETTRKDDLEKNMGELAALFGLKSDISIEGGLPENLPQGIQITVDDGLPQQIGSLLAQSQSAEADGIGDWPYPSLDLKGRYGSQQYGSDHQELSNGEPYNSYVGAQLSVSLWDSISGRQKESLKRQSQAVSFEADGLAAEWKSEVRLSKSRFVRWGQLVKILEERKTFARDYRNRISQEYSLGVKNSQDLKDATQNELNTDLNWIDNLARFWEVWARSEALNAQNINSQATKEVSPKEENK